MTVGVVVWLTLGAFPAGAQTDAPPPVGDSVGVATIAVDLAGVNDPGPDRGVLVRTDSTSAAPMLAVYLGLSIVGLTLGVITARRRLLAVKATERITGVVVGRRTRTEFWNLGLRPNPAGRLRGGRSPFQTAQRSALPMLLGSGDTVTITEHGPPVRAGYAGGATDG